MVMNPDDPNYANQPDERDPTRECPHGAPYECPHGVLYVVTCPDCEEEREADDESDTGFLMIVEPDEEADRE